MNVRTGGWTDRQTDRHAHLIGSVSLENPTTLNYQRTTEDFPEEAGRNYATLSCPPSALYFFLTWPRPAPSFRCVGATAHIHSNFLRNAPQINTSQSETVSYF